jgi:hypothetical protein
LALKGGALRRVLVIVIALLGCALPQAALADQWTMQRLSTGPAGGNAAIPAAFGPSTRDYNATPDGRRVVILTAERLTTDDTDNVVDAYIRSDTAITRVSVGPEGGNGGWNVDYAMISADGSTVVFATGERLTANDPDGFIDLYKRVGDTTTLLTIGPHGTKGDCLESGWASPCNEFRGMSDDGRTVFFVTGGHLVTGDEEPSLCSEIQEDKGIFDYWSCTDIYANVDGVTSLLSGSAEFDGTVDHDISPQLISRDGDAYFSTFYGGSSAIFRWTAGVRTQVATGNIDGITEDGEHLFYHSNFQIWEHSSAGDSARTPGPAFTVFRGVSADGERIYFTTDSSLVPQDTDTGLDLYGGGRDSSFQLITEGGNADFSHFGFLDNTTDGGKVYFKTRDAFDPADHDTAEDIYEFTSATGARKLLSTGPLDPGTNTPSFAWIGVSEDGSRLFFETTTKLLDDDTNTANDIYGRTAAGVSLVTRTPDWAGGISQFSSSFLQGRRVSLDGTRVLFTTDWPLLASDTDSQRDVYAADYAGPGGGEDPGLYVRPAGATPFRVSLVPAAAACTAPNTQHGGPLAFGSCNPVRATSPFTTLGAPGGTARSIGFVRFDVGADVRITFDLSNVLWQDTFADYGSGQLRVEAGLRLTDTGVSGQTVVDTAFGFDVQCVETASPEAGARCQQTTTANAVVPGIAPSGSRAIWQLDRVVVRDGGEDGQVATIPGENLPLAVQGIYAP